MIYDELIEELALTLLTKARYEGCISVIDGFSQCEEDKTRIEYPVDAVMRIMPVGSEIWPEECEPLLKKIGAETIGDVADYLNKNESENSSADDVLSTALLKICYENMDMDGKMVFWEDMLENNSLEWRDGTVRASIAFGHPNALLGSSPNPRYAQTRSCDSAAAERARVPLSF